MKKNLISILVCPKCKGKLQLDRLDLREDGGEVRDGRLICKNQHSFLIRNYIARFVETDDYVQSFSFEWTRHSQTQLDSRESVYSHGMFQQLTGWSPEFLRKKLVLDVGCGMGRYADVAERMGATVIAIDLSYAVDAAYRNIGHRKNVHVLQANILELPFRESTFDCIYSLGVLHHTPNTEEAFSKLPGLLKPGGELAVWVYAQYFGQRLHDLIRVSFTSRLPRKVLHYFCWFLSSPPVYYIYRIPILRQLLQILFWYPADGEMYKQWRWRWLDLFDFYSPTYASRHTYPEVVRWFGKAGLRNIRLQDTPVAVSGNRG